MDSLAIVLPCTAAQSLSPSSSAAAVATGSLLSLLSPVLSTIRGAERALRISHGDARQQLTLDVGCTVRARAPPLALLADAPARFPWRQSHALHSDAKNHSEVVAPRALSCCRRQLSNFASPSCCTICCIGHRSTKGTATSCTASRQMGHRTTRRLRSRCGYLRNSLLCFLFSRASYSFQHGLQAR